MIENNDDSYLQDRMSPVIAFFGYGFGAALIALMFILARPVYG